MTKAKMERRDLTMDEFDTMVSQLEMSERPELASVLFTHRTVAERDGFVELGRKMWADIEKMVDITYQQGGLPVTVITEDGVGSGRLMPDDSIVLEYPEASDGATVVEYPDNPDGMSDDEVMELDRKMDLILAPGTVYSEDGKTAFVPDEVLAESDPDAELDEAAFPQCRCGCGGRTKGGRFIPGHDAKLKAKLMRVVFYNEGFEEGDSAMLELQLRGWAKFYPAFAKNETKRARRANVVRCDICGRPLTDEESVAAGRGPVCSGRHN